MPWRNDPDARRRSAETYGDPEYQRNRKAALRRAGRRCEKCQSWKDVQVDHVIPVSQGGTHALANLMVLCGDCHATKTATEGGGFRKPARDPAPRPRTQW